MALLIGVVEAGRGLGAARMADPSVRARFEDAVGFTVVPGTLNVRLDAPLDRSLLSGHLAAADIDPDWAAATGQVRYRWAPATVAGHSAVVGQADEDGYPPDLIEVLAATHLRSALGLADGDRVEVHIVE